MVMATHAIGTLPHPEPAMNEDVLNTSLRKFLKKVGVTSQREIEKAVRAADQRGELGVEALAVRVTLVCPQLDLAHEIEDRIAIE